MTKSTTVLVVEDNDLLRETMCDLVMAIRPDWRIVEAENGLDGIAVAQRAQPDLIILDFNMPVMNGYEMAVQLQESPETKQIPLILNSGEDAAHPLIIRLRGMCEAVLNKPFSLREIEYVFNDIFGESAPRSTEFGLPMQAVPA